MQVKAEFPLLKHQYEFAHLKERNSCILGGFGSGKSEGLVAKGIKKLIERDKPVICLIAPTNLLLEDVNIPDFINTFERFNVKYGWVSKTFKKMYVNSGKMKGELWFRSADRPEKIVGFDATDMLIDEYDILRIKQQKELWTKCIARMRGCKDATISIATTPEGFKETYELFHKKKIGPLIRAKTTDNPFLPDDFIQSLYDQYDPLLVKQYIEAEFVNINGMAAYYAFRRDKNHLDTDIKWLKDSKVINFGIDFNVSKMCAQFFLHDEHRQRMHFFDEVVLKNNADTEKMCRVIKDKFPDKTLIAYPDASGDNRSTNATRTDIQILRNNGIRVYARSSNPFVRDRLNSANSKLHKNEVTIDTNKCLDLTEDLEKVILDQYGELDKSDETITHSSDAFSYPISYLYSLKKYGGGVIG